MNKTQKNWIVVGLVAFIASCLYLPQVGYNRSLEYRWFLSPMLDVPSIFFLALIAEWLVILATTIALFLVFADEK